MLSRLVTFEQAISETESELGYRYRLHGIRDEEGLDLG